jgi:hypothetical protein
MIELHLASVDEMVLAFLKAEINSVRFKPFVDNALAHFGFAPDLIIDADLTNDHQNRERMKVLSYRRGLFAGLPPMSSGVMSYSMRTT